MKLQCLARRLRLLHRDEDAQGMVFGAISLFMLAACMGLVHNSGVITSRRIQAQTAADAAAYAGSLTTANVISDVAWMNDGMAYVYYNLMRYAVDATVYRTVAEVKEHNKWIRRGGEIRLRNDYLDPGGLSAEYGRLSAEVGGDPVARYLAAYQRASEMIPRGEKWLQILSDMEDALAIAGKYLVREAILKTAAEEGNDVAAVAMLQTDPTGTIFKHRSNVEDIDMIVEYNPNGQPLWSITYNGRPYMEIYKHGPNHWEIVRPGIQSVDIYRHSDNEWTITTGKLVTRIKRHPDGTLEVTTSGAQNAHLLCMPLADGLWAITGQTGGVNVDYKPFKDGGYLLTVNGSTVGIREYNGKMQHYVNGVWRDIPAQGTVTVGGEEIPIRFNNHIDLNPPHNVPSLDFPGILNLGPISFTLPNRVHFAGANITLERDTVRITAQVGNVGLTIDGDKDNCVSLNGRSTCDPNSANKRGYWIHGVYGHDRIETVTPGRKWIYKWRKIRAIFEREDMERFGHHAVEDAALATNVENDWTEWFDVGTGARKNGTAYHQTVPCWNHNDIHDVGGRDGFVGMPVEHHRCPTCNPYHHLIDYDQRFEITGIGDWEVDKDGDGASDVRKYGVNDLFFRAHVSDQENARDFQSIQIGGNVSPFCLTESVFAHPLVVAVWIQADAPFLGTRFVPPVEVYRDHRGEIRARRTGPARWVPFFRNPDWGYFAVACSRTGVLNNDRSSYCFTFDDDVDLRYDFDFGDSEFERRMENRDGWLASWHNLYEPVWTARLWATAETVKSVDMEIAQRQQELGIWEEISKNFVWRALQNQSPWMDPDSPEVIDPDYVPGARAAFHRMRGPLNERFQVDMRTPPEYLEEALKH